MAALAHFIDYKVIKLTRVKNLEHWISPVCFELFEPVDLKLKQTSCQITAFETKKSRYEFDAISSIEFISAYS